MQAAAELVDRRQFAVPLRDPDTGAKIRLRLRRMEFAKEIESLPK